MTRLRNLAFVSSLLFTIALVCLIPSQIANVRAARGDLSHLDAGYTWGTRLLGDLGISSLVIIFIGLITAWTGYVKRVRWTWFVMFVIVFAWAFPLLILPFFQPPPIVLTVSEWLSRAIKEPGPARDGVEEILIFSLMVIALFLPIKAFFWKQKRVFPVVSANAC